MIRPIAVISLPLLAWAVVARAEQPAARQPADEPGMPVDAASAAAYLRSLYAPEENRQAIDSHIEQLGDDSFAVRQRASRFFRDMPRLPMGRLKEAARSEDPEVRWRVREILDHDEPQYGPTLYAVLKTIETGKLQGLAADLLRLVPLCTDEYLENQLGRALQQSATRADADLLRQSLASDNVQVRVATIGALGTVLGGEAREALSALLADENEKVRLAACRALAYQGDRACLAPLGQLLESDDVALSAQSQQLLRALTGQTIGFLAYDSSKDRQHGITAWQKWIAESGPTAKLKPVSPAGPRLLGRTLICFVESGAAIELDTEGREIWRSPTVIRPSACQGLPNGHRLLASESGSALVEFDSHGREVWRIKLSVGRVESVDRMDNGNTLVACADGTVYEFTPSSPKPSWKNVVGGRPVDAHRLTDGSTLVAMQTSNMVVEIDPKGRWLWQISDLASPTCAKRLENGNTLVCEATIGRVSEYDRAGKRVWVQADFDYPSDAQRLPNGNTVVAHRKGVSEIDDHGKVVWEHRVANPSRICRY